MILYHGTHMQNIATLKPFATRRNAISKPVICFTPNPQIALFYIWNRSYKWITFNENENGKAVFTEHYENMLYDFYNHISGSIYECDRSNPNISPTHMKGVYVSESPIEAKKETVVANAYDEILKQESLGNIIVQRYDKLSANEKSRITKSTIQAIHMQKLLIPSDHLPIIEQTAFVRSHFPVEWDIASKMTKQEIDAMINEWRASLQKR